MAWRILLLALLLGASSHSLRAVGNISTGTATPTYTNTTAPTTQITNWQTGWSQPTTQPTGYSYTTGWNYVGSVPGAGGASAVYLGNGWVITCAHVGAGNFKLNGTTYNYVADSVHTFTGTATQTVMTSSGTTTSPFVNPVDFTLFQISQAPNLPALPLRQSIPVLNGSEVAMIGYGDGGSHSNETWGYDTLNYAVNLFVNLSGLPYWTNDFSTANGGTTDEYQLEGGDSGGAAFIYNSTLGRWELAGLNEGNFSNNTGGSVFVELNNSTFSTGYADDPASGDTTTYTGTTTYETQLALLMQPPGDTPTLPPWALVLMGGALFCLSMPAVLLERR